MVRPRIHVLVLLSCSGLSAGIRPSLDLEMCSWNATDILVAAPAGQDGKFKVVETIKGETQPGTVLRLEGWRRRSGRQTA